MGVISFFPDVTTIFFCALIMGLLILVLPHLVKRLPWIKPTKDDTDFVIRMQGTLFTLVGLLLAFTLVQTQNYQRQANSSITSEASVLNRMDRLLARYGSEQAMAVRPQLLAYTQAIVTDEWPAMMAGETNEATRHAWGRVSRGVLALSPTNTREEALFGELLRSLNDVVEARDERLSTVPLQLPYTYWIAILFAVCMLLFVSSTLTPSRFRATNLVAQMAALGAVLGFVLIQDQQFTGEISKGPEPIIHIIDVMKLRSNG